MPEHRLGLRQASERCSLSRHLAPASGRRNRSGSCETKSRLVTAPGDHGARQGKPYSDQRFSAADGRTSQQPPGRAMLLARADKYRRSRRAPRLCGSTRGWAYLSRLSSAAVLSLIIIANDALGAKRPPTPAAIRQLHSVLKSSPSAGSFIAEPSCLLGGWARLR